MNKFSVIIPVYNVEKYIEKCIESIKQQTEKDFEVILVDDGSTDSCPYFCDSIAMEDERFHVIHKKNGGLISAWMAGLEAARSDYIIFVDSDDWVQYKSFEIMWKIVEKYNVDMVVINYRKVVFQNEFRSNFSIHQGLYKGEQLPSEIYPRMLNDGDFQKRGIPTSRHGKIIKKSILLDNLKYCDQRVSYQEDLSIILPTLLSIKSLYLLDEPDADYMYRQNPFSILHTYNPDMYEQIQIVYDNLFKCIRDKHAEFMKKQIYADCLAAVVQCYKNELMSNNYRHCIARIQLLAHDKLFLYSAQITKWHHYRFLNCIIINCLLHWNFFSKHFVTRVLYILKKIKIKKMLLQEKNSKLDKGNDTIYG